MVIMEKKGFWRGWGGYGKSEEDQKKLFATWSI